MSVVVSDLVARVRAEGVEQTAQQVKAVGDAATQTARALEIMAQAAAKQGGGTAQGWMEIFTKGNVQPTAAAMAQAAQEMQRVAAATAQAVQPTQAVAAAAERTAAAMQQASAASRTLNVSPAFAAMENARSGAEESRLNAARAEQQKLYNQLAREASGETANGAKAAQQVADGWRLSESSLVRFGAALAGISLGISLVAGAARLVHDAIIGTVQSQVDWERSLVQVSAMYGQLAPRVIALSQAQAALPGVISSQQELLQANTAAQFLTTRYGVSADVTGTLTTQAARLGGLYVLPAEQRQALQEAFLNYARTGAGGQQLEAATGQAFDPLSLARRLGFPSEAGLQALTPQQLDQARAQLGIAAAAQTNMRGGGQPRALLDAQRAAEQNLARVQAQVQNTLESAGQGAVPVFGNANVGVSELGQYYNRATGQPIDPQTGAPLTGALGPQPASTANGAFVSALQDVREARSALAENAAKNAAALADNQKQLDAANAALSKLGVQADSAAARLLSFTGSLEDSASIARGDVAAQAQATVAARGRSAIPSIGLPTAEIAYQATQTAYQQAYQNYVALQAQGSQDNALRDWLQRRATSEGPGGAAQRALDQAQQAQPIQQAMGEAQRAQSQIDLAAAERQAQLDQITLTQRERYVQLMQQTVALRLQDNSLQQEAIRASSDVIRAQQAVLPSERTASSAQYQQNLAQAYARQRMGRLLQGRDVSDLPSLDQLINMRYQGQLTEAENGVALVQGERGVQVAQQNATGISLQDTLVQNNVRLAELQVDAENLRDIPRQTQYELELVQINRDQISVQTEMREYLKALVWIMTNQPSGGTGVGGGNGGSSAPLTPPDVPGNRRGPF